MTYRIGIDAGSKTIKVVVADQSGAVERSVYRRHRADIRTTLAEVLHDLVWRYGDVSGTVAITGSAGIELAAMLDVPFVQEVMATARAVKSTHPTADAIIELGGEDAKVVYLTGNHEQRMNATCAGGTGGFIDTIAFMLGVSARDMSSLAMGATKTYPIASRCAVFAQTDVRPLLNAGAKKTDIAASVLDAVVKQTLGGLACGRPIAGTVVFLGGPLEHIPSLVYRFRKALGLDHRTGIKPADAHLFTALGAALLSDDPARLEHPVAETSLSALESALVVAAATDDSLPRLEPLFACGEDYAAFRTRHAARTVPRRRLSDAEGTLYLGIDAGSTAVKLAAIDEAGALVYSDYQSVSGDVLSTASAMLIELYRALPHEYDGRPLCSIAHATVTGYGESLLMAAFGIDSGVVETTAHMRAARMLQPNVSFVLDIGGQDMKALWVEDGTISKAMLNEACSSGCGSFIEGSAHSLRCTPYGFADIAVRASSPVDLGTKCTVFMTSRVRHAQKIGISYGDISAGIAYSVVNNALFKVIGLDNVDSLGDRIVVQGGAFLSDAVLRAFELVTGKQVLRPSIAHLMGAYGAALVARSRGGNRKSTLLDRDEIAAIKPRFRTETCPGCTNSCMLSIVSFESGDASKHALGGTAPGSSAPSDMPRCFVDGNRCERAYGFYGHAQGRVGAQGDAAVGAPNTVALEQRLLARYGDVRADPESLRGGTVIGLPSTLNDFGALPFWHTLMTSLGFSVASGLHAHLGTGGIDTVASESVCYPAKITHQRLFSLSQNGVTALFMPEYQRGFRCPVSSLYARAVADGVPSIGNGRIALVSPRLTSIKPPGIVASEDDRASLLASLNTCAPHEAPIGPGEIEHALACALGEQERFDEMIERACDKALSWIGDHQGHGIMLAGRPYHADPALNHGIDTVLSALGFAVLGPKGLSSRIKGEAFRTSNCPTIQDNAYTGREALWKQGKRLNRLAAFAAARDNIDLVCLQSFGCAYDAVNLLEVRSTLEAAGHPFTALTIDEIADTAHVLIRLRTLADTIEERRGPRVVENQDPTALPAPYEPNTGKGVPEPEPREADCAERRSVALGRIEYADIEVGRREVSQDVCSTVSAVAGRIIRLCRADSSIDRIIVDEGCISCLFDALPDLVKAPLGRVIDVVLEQRWSVDAALDERDRAHIATPDSGAAISRFPSTLQQPRIGIVGNPYLVFESPLNDDLVAYLESLGCEVALPEARSLLTDDVRYLDQLARWEQEEIDHVIYVQSFGCLKGHVESRGALRSLGKRFPNLPITVIDYDPDASALNRINRILLVVESSRNAHASGEL